MSDLALLGVVAGGVGIVLAFIFGLTSRKSQEPPHLGIGTSVRRTSRERDGQ
jgi:hypothetical protein